MVILNNSDNYESIMVRLTPKDTPIAYEHRVVDIMTGGASRKEAEKLALEPYELELYFESGTGLFAVDPMAVESGTIYSPYSREPCQKSENK